MISMALDRDPRRTWSKPISHNRIRFKIWTVCAVGTRYEHFKRGRVLQDDRTEIVPNGAVLESMVLTNCTPAPTPRKAGSVNWSWWRGLVLVRIRIGQGSQEPAKGHCCGWPRVVPLGTGERDPRTVLTGAASSSPIARSCFLRCRKENTCGSGHNPAIVDTELVVSLKPPHQLHRFTAGWPLLLRMLFVLGRVCRDRWRV